MGGAGGSGAGAGGYPAGRGALANRTGGYLVERDADAKAAGETLAAAVSAPVCDPEAAEVNRGAATEAPSPLPPLRSDRGA